MAPLEMINKPMNEPKTNKLKLRLLTASVLMPLVIFSVFALSLRAFALLTGFVVLLGAWEWTTLMGLHFITMRVLYLLLIASLCWLSLSMNIGLVLVVSLVWWR